MIEALTVNHDLRSNPQIMIKGKATPVPVKSRVGQSKDSDAESTSPKLSTEERKILQDLKLRDSAVRQEEEAHARLLGRHAGAIRYEYQIGPDGRVYVINGSVEVAPKFNSSDPEEIKKVLKMIQRAAVSVSNPSQADLNVAASAAARTGSLNQKDVLDTYMKGVDSQSAPKVQISHPTQASQLNVQA